MAKYVSPFSQLASGKSSSSQGYTSPFAGLTASGVSQHRKELAKATEEARIKADAQAAIDAKAKSKGKSVVSKVNDFMNAAGEQTGTILAKTLTGIVGQAERVPTLARFAKPVLPSSVDKKIDQVIVEPTRRFSDRTVGHFDKTYLQPDQAILEKSSAGSKFGKVEGELASVLGQIAAPTPKVTSLIKGATRSPEEITAATRTAGILNDMHNLNRTVDLGKTATKSATAETRQSRLISTQEGNAYASLRNRLSSLQDEKNTLMKDPNAYSTNPEDLRSMAGEPAGNVRLTKSGQPYKNSKAGTFAENRGATIADSKDTASRLREINREQASIRAEMNKKVAAAPHTVTDETIKPPPSAPKTPRTAPSDNIFKKDPAESIRSRITNQLLSTTGLLSRHGKEGKQLADKVNKYNQTARDLSTEWFNRMPTFGKLNKNETANFARATQGLEKPLNDKVAQAVGEWKSVAPDIRNQFIKHSGEEIGNIENFFPHSIKPEFLKRGSSGFNAAVKHLVDSGQVKTPGEAVNVLNFARRSNTKGNVLGSFKFSRDFQLPDHMYDTSKNAIANYLEGAAHSVAGAKELGMDRNGVFHHANELIGAVADRGGNADKVKHTFEQAMGLAQHSEALTKASNVTRSVQIFTKLGLGAITNAGQTVNTIIKNGFIDTAKGLGYLATKEGRQFARESGAFTHGLISDLREQRGISNRAGKVGAPFFNNVEQFNRYLASTAGKFHGERLAKRGGKYATGELRKSGVEGAIGKTLTKEQQLRAGRGSSDATQFIVAPHTLPGWSTSPVGKLVSQFQTFSYKQSGFVWNEIIKPLNQGNALPLVRLMAVLPAAYGLYRVKAGIRGKDRTNDNKVIEAWRAAGGGGTAENLITGTVNAKKYSSSGKEFAANETAAVGGVTAGTLMDTLGSVYGLSTGKPKAAKQQGLALVPIIGSRLKNTYAPSGSQSGRDIRTVPVVNKELNRLGYKIQDTNQKTGRAAQLSGTDYNRFIDGSTKLFSDRAQQALNDPQYQSLSEDDKKNTMTNILSQSRADVLDLLVGKPKRSSTPKYKSYR